MPSIELSLPPGVVAKGSLPEGQSIPELVDDMLEIDLPDGTTIDVGWVPEHDPKGQYRLVVFRDWWMNQVADPLFTRSREDVIRLVNSIARRQSRNSPTLKSSHAEQARAEQTTVRLPYDYRQRSRFLRCKEKAGT